MSSSVLSHFSRVWLFATLWTVAHQAPFSIGILQARILEWVAMPSSRESSPSMVWTCVSYVSCSGRWGLLPLAPPGKPGFFSISSKTVTTSNWLMMERALWGEVGIYKSHLIYVFDLLKWTCQNTLYIHAPNRNRTNTEKLERTFLANPIIEHIMKSKA